jgi:hypothetical protein
MSGGFAMNRSVGVTVIAVLALLGSGLTLLMGILMAVVMAVAPVPTQPEFPASPAFFRVMLLAASLMYVLPAIWGILTGIGLFQLKNWARISIIVFSVLLTLMGGFSALMVLLIPFFPLPNGTADPSVMAAMRVFLGVFCLAQLGIGIWWLVFFNRANVKQQFVAASVIPVAPTSTQPGYTMPTLPAPSTTVVRKASRRPLSFTILAWFLLVCCLFFPLNFVLRPPVPLFTMLLTGWPAQLYLGILGVLQLYVGVGLLRLQPAARVVGVGLFGFAFVNSGIFYFSPGGRVRMLALSEAQQAMFPWMRSWQSQPAFQFDLTPFLVIGACSGMAVIVVTLYFLITRKEAYENAALAAQ